MTTLIVGASCFEGLARRLLIASALTLTAGISLTGIGCDLLRLTLACQIQPWRCQWIAAVTAAVCIPSITAKLWGGGPVQRNAALTLLASWIFGVGQFAIIACVVALASLCLKRLKPRELLLILWGSFAILVLAIIWRTASNLEFAESHFMDESLPEWFRRLASFTHDGFAPMLAIGSLVWLANSRHKIFGRWLAAAVGAVLILVLWPVAWSMWSHELFPHRQIERFAEWRDAIAPSQEVFWGESPLSSWVLLNRPNYLSSEQTSGLVFGRASALEFQRRAMALSPAIPPATFLDWDNAGEHLSLSPNSLGEICHLGVFDYLVTSLDLGTKPAAIIDKLKLYACSTQARAAAAAT